MVCISFKVRKNNILPQFFFYHLKEWFNCIYICNQPWTGKLFAIPIDFTCTINNGAIKLLPWMEIITVKMFMHKFFERCLNWVRIA